MRSFLGASICVIFLAGCGSSTNTPAGNGTTGTTGTAGSAELTTAGGGGDTATTAGAGGSMPDTVAPPDTTSKVAVNGIVTAGPWLGAGFTAAENGTVSPDCSSMTSCTPPFTGANMCMTGTVKGMADYSGFAMLGWNVNQPEGMMPATWAIPETGGITVSVVSQPATTAMRVQLQGVDPKDAAGRWCAPIVPGKQIAWTDFKTNCWTGGKPQTPLAAGTMIQQAAITVPGLTVDLPFNVCLVDIQIQ